MQLTAAQLSKLGNEVAEARQRVPPAIRDYVADTLSRHEKFRRRKKSIRVLDYLIAAKWSGALGRNTLAEVLRAIYHVDAGLDESPRRQPDEIDGSGNLKAADWVVDPWEDHPAKKVETFLRKTLLEVDSQITLSASGHIELASSLKLIWERAKAAGNSQASAPTDGGGPFEKGNHVHCEAVGDDDLALMELATLLPLAELVEDTTVRVHGTSQYRDDVLAEFEKGLRAMLRKRGSKFVLLTGPMVDEKYQLAVQRAALDPERKGKVEFRRLRHVTPMMNFVILTFPKASVTPIESRREVRFGYGRLDPDRDEEAVFRSTNEYLVREFQNLFELLTQDPRFSTPVDATEDEFVRPNAIAATAYDKWDDGEFMTFLDEAPRGSELRIQTSYFINLPNFEDKIDNCLQRDVRISLLMMNPENRALVYSRFAVREDNNTFVNAFDELRRQKAYLEALPGKVQRQRPNSKGSLKIRYSDIMPLGFMAHGDHGAIVGLMPSTWSYVRAPMIKTTAHSPMWKSLLELDWEARWKEAEGEWQGPGKWGEGTPAGLVSYTDEGLLGAERTIPVEEKSKEIWVAGNLSNVGEDTSVYSKRVRQVVHQNARDGISYHYIFVRDRAGLGKIEKLQTCFEDTIGDLYEHPITEEQLRGLTLVNSHFICFNPRDKERRIAYMQIPAETTAKGWIRLSRSDSESVLTAMEALMKKKPRPRTSTPKRPRPLKRTRPRTRR